jgi:hypothetical protein
MAIRIRQVVVSATLSAMIAGLAAVPLTASAQPQLSMQSEEVAHPRLVQSIRDCQAAYRQLEAAPDNFGGNKAQAMADLRQAIHSLRRALYFRLNLDDAASDRIQ